MLKCEIGNPVHSGWCHPCRVIGMCLRLPIPQGHEDRSTPLPFKPDPPLSPEQGLVIDELEKWYRSLEKAGTITVGRGHGIGEDADALGVHPRTMWSLWRRGWIRRVILADRRARDKWFLTDAAWDYLNAETDEDSAA